MKYGNDDQAGQSDVDRARARSRRFVQLNLMERRTLVRVYLGLKQKHGVQEHPTAGATPPATKDALVAAIVNLEETYEQQ